MQDLVARTETNKLVTDLVDLDRVRSLLKTISLRRQFLKKRAKKFEKGKVRGSDSNLCSNNLADIPSIVVQDMPETPPMSSRDIASAGLEQSPGSPTPMSKQINQGDYSLATDTGLRIQRKTRWTNDHSTYSGDFSNSRCGLRSFLGLPSHYQADQHPWTMRKILCLLCTIQFGEVRLSKSQY